MKYHLVEDCWGCGYYNDEYGDCVLLDKDIKEPGIILKDCPLKDYPESVYEFLGGEI